jgi:uncharacterized protein
MSESSIRVSLVFSPQPRQVMSRELVVQQGMTLLQAIELSGFLAQFPEIDLQNEQQFSVGIWGRQSSLNHVLRDLDRVEIYRPLKVDPKVARRERFQKQGVRGAGLFSKRRPGAKPGY